MSIETAPRLPSVVAIMPPYFKYADPALKYDGIGRVGWAHAETLHEFLDLHVICRDGSYNPHPEDMTIHALHSREPLHSLGRESLAVALSEVEEEIAEIVNVMPSETHVLDYWERPALLRRLAPRIGKTILLPQNTPSRENREFILEGLARPNTIVAALAKEHRDSFILSEEQRNRVVVLGSGVDPKAVRAWRDPAFGLAALTETLYWPRMPELQELQSRNVPYAVYGGGIGPHKGPAILLALTKDIMAGVIVGDPDPANPEDMLYTEHLLEDSRVIDTRQRGWERLLTTYEKDPVLYCGSRTSEEMLEALGCAMCCILPSGFEEILMHGGPAQWRRYSPFREPFNLVAEEAKANGTPLLVSDEGNRLLSAIAKGRAGRVFTHIAEGRKILTQQISEISRETCAQTVTMEDSLHNAAATLLQILGIPPQLNNADSMELWRAGI